MQTYSILMSKIQNNEGRHQQCFQALNTLQDELNTLKIGLSKLLSKEFGAELLVRLDTFQTLLLDHDAAIALLRHELSVRMKSMDRNAGTPNNFSAADPTIDIKLIAEKIQQLKVQLSGYTTALTRSER